MELDEAKQKVDQFEWQDADSSQLSTIPIAVIDFLPSESSMKYYKRLRYLLQKEQENSDRAYALTTMILLLNTTNYYALMLRKNSWNQEKTPMHQQIAFINQLLQMNPKQYHLWTYKKQLFEKASIQLVNQIIKYQYEFIQKLLIEDTKNYHVWDYRTYLTMNFHFQEQEILKSQTMIFSKLPTISQTQVVNLWAQCNSLWSYRFNLIKNQPSAQKQKILQKQPSLVRNFILEYPKNQCAWNYLTGMSLDLNIKPQEIKNNLELASKLGKQKNRFALNLVLQVEPSKQVIEELMAVDATRQTYYKYLLENDV